MPDDSPSSPEQPVRRPGRPRKAEQAPGAAGSWPAWYTTRSAFRERLEKEGREKEYIARREALKKVHTIEEANRLAAIEFPPLPDNLLVSADAPADETLGPSPETTEDDFAGKPPGGPLDTVAWVAENYSRTDIQAKDAPSGAAWNLLIEMRRNPNLRASFWTQIFTRTMPSQKSIDEGDRYADKGNLVLDVLLATKAMRELEAADAAANPSLSIAASSRPESPAAEPPANLPFPPPASSRSYGQTSRDW